MCPNSARFLERPPMTDIIDIHTHTIASMHAYSTIREMAAAAKEKGLALLGISDHAPALPGTFHELYFHNFKVIRPAAYGIDLIMGAELNVLDHTGTVDLPEKALKKLHYVIASLHDLVIAPGSQEENTAALLGAMENPYVTIIGHPDNPVYPIDFDALARAAAAQHILIEANNSSHNPGGSRPGSDLLARDLLAAATARISSWAATRTSTSMSANTAIRAPSSQRRISRTNSS